jgi:hypothetical protein
MIRALFVVSATAAAALALLVGANPAAAEVIAPAPAPVLAPLKADLVISSHDGSTFTVTNALCGPGEVCIGGSGYASANNFRVRVTVNYLVFHFAWFYWESWTGDEVVASLAPGASLTFPYTYGFCPSASITIDPDGTVPERNEGNNTGSFNASPRAVWC